MSSLLEQNLRVIETTSPGLKEALHDLPSATEPNFQLFNEIELHKKGSSPLVAVMGVENIDALRTLRADLRRYTAVVAEPDLAKLKYLLSNRDLTDLLEDTNVVFVWGEAVDDLGTEVEQFYSVAMIDDIKRIPPVPERHDEFARAEEGLETFREFARINTDTIEEFLTEWHQYFPRNISTYLNGTPLDELDGALEGQSLTIVGPGPSLDEFTDELETLSEGWLISLDTALPILMELGIEPDIVVSVDVGDSNLRFLDDYPEKATLFSPSYMNPRALEQAERTILFDSLFPPSQWLQPQVESPGILMLSGSVATAAFDLALGLSPSECYLAGMDLAVPDLMRYSKRSAQYQDCLHHLNRFTSIPDQLLIQLQDRQLTRADSPRGPLLTTDQYMNWKDSLDVFVEEASFPFFQLGDRVIPLEGARLTKRINRFNEQSTDRLPESRTSHVVDPDGLKRRVKNLLNAVEQFKTELEMMESKRRRDKSILTDWLNLVGQFSEHDEFLNYFQWEIDRVTQELQDTPGGDNQELSEKVDRQFERWQNLLTATEDGFKRLL